MQGAAFIAVMTTGLLAAICLTASAVLALSLVIEPWLSALLFGGVLLAVSIGGIFKLRASIRRFTPIPTRSVQNVERDIEVVKEALR